MLGNATTGAICIEDLEIGTSRHLQKAVTDRDIIAEVSTDPNPVHIEDAYARHAIF